MFSSPTFRTDQQGAVRYLANDRIRTIAVYNNKIEYDVSFSTNNLGFVDNIDYKYTNEPGKEYYAFVGDSFTAGYHGGVPWITELRNKILKQNTDIYNLGVSGTGLEHFRRLLTSISTDLNFTHIVIMAISNDFEREFWHPQATATEIRFCPEDENTSKCVQGPYIARIFEETSTHEDILKIANKANKDRRRHFQQSSNIAKRLLKKSDLLTFINRTLKTTFIQKHRDSPISLDSLKEIRSAFPHVQLTLIHLPQKQEVRKGEYLQKNIGAKIQQMGIAYFPALKDCSWQNSMFFVNDGHPNSAGYDNITTCVSNYLFEGV